MLIIIFSRFAVKACWKRDERKERSKKEKTYTKFPGYLINNYSSPKSSPVVFKVRYLLNFYIIKEFLKNIPRLSKGMNEFLYFPDMVVNPWRWLKYHLFRFQAGIFFTLLQNGLVFSMKQTFTQYDMCLKSWFYLEAGISYSQASECFPIYQQ